VYTVLYIVFVLDSFSPQNYTLCLSLSEENQPFLFW